MPSWSRPEGVGEDLVVQAPVRSYSGGVTAREAAGESWRTVLKLEGVVYSSIMYLSMLGDMVMSKREL